MSLRDEFEKLFPPNESDAERQDALWLGFQAGHAAGLEDARSEYARTHVTVRVPAHSDSTEQ